MKNWCRDVLYPSLGENKKGLILLDSLTTYKEISEYGPDVTGGKELEILVIPPGTTGFSNFQYS